MSKELTRRAIVTSFVNLLNERPLDKITVKDIVEDCGVNRNTFYYHYQDIYALVEDIFEKETEKVVQEHQEHFTWQDGFIESAQFALQNKKAIYHIYNSVKREQLEQYLFQITESLMTHVVTQLSEGLSVSQEDIHYIVVFYKHAIVGIILEWIQRGMKDDPEHVIHRMGELFDGNIRRTLERIAE